MIKMKALRAGNIGDGATRVKRGREFSVQNETRAKELEDEGLAFRVEVKAEPTLQNKMEPPPSNKAAEAGPLDSHGGTTGAEEPVQSSPLARPLRVQAPRRSKEDSRL